MIKKYFPLLLLILLSSASIAFSAHGRSELSPKEIDSAADRAKATNVVETASPMITSNLMGAALMFNFAKDLSPNDSNVLLATNNFDLLIAPQQNPLYYAQRDLLEASSNAPIMYYFTLNQSTPPQNSPADSMAFFDTAVKAYNRFPGEQIFIEYLLESGTAYAYNKKFRRNANDSLDTLALEPKTIAFVDTLLRWNDTIESRHGYSHIIDHSRAFLYNILDRKDDMRQLMQSLMARDSSDVETLDLLQSLAYLNGDSTLLTQLGLRRFELEPEDKHVFSLYEAMPNDSLREILKNAVIKKAVNTDLDPDLRLSLLAALIDAYYLNSEELLSDSQFLLDINDALAEITAEDPLNLSQYMRATFISSRNNWIGNYGVRHWIDAVENIEDSTLTEIFVAAPLAALVTDNPEFEKSVIKLIDFHEPERPDITLTTQLALAQYYFNSELFSNSLQILQSVTLQKLKDASQFTREYILAHPEEYDTDESQEPDDLERYIMVKTLISECYMQLDKVDEALATLNEIIAIQPDNSGALNNLAYYMSENGKDLDIALSLAERSLKLEPDNLNTIDTRAWILYLKGDVDGALDDMRTFFSILHIDLNQDLLNPDNPRSPYTVLEENTSLDVISPIIGHLLAILDKKGDTDPKVLAGIADALRKIDPENSELKAFLAKNQ